MDEPASYILKGSIGQVGVVAFFFISGFLITQSYLRDENPKKFLVSRCLRIFPALIIVVLFTAFVIGPILTNLSIQNYFKNTGTYSYLTTLTLFNEKSFLPGVSNQLTINCALWTLRYEFSFYLFILLLGIFRLLKRRWILLGITILSLTLFHFTIGLNSNLYTLNILQTFRLLAYFGLGATIYLYREYIPLKPWIFLLISSTLILGSLFGGFTDDLFIFPFCYVILFLGYHPDFNLRWMSKYGDFSYGIYIWHAPIIVSLVYLFNLHLGDYRLFLIDLGITLPVAIISWHLVEKRMLKLKDNFNNDISFIITKKHKEQTNELAQGEN
jgi:peptidoglycan/LPS O-acetylase OafA/YrhL